MPYIQLRPDLYGITSLLDFRKETADPICTLTQLLLRGESTLTGAERELIAAYVSIRNDCTFCSSAHATASCLLPGGADTGIETSAGHLEKMNLSAKMKSLLQLAGKVQLSGLDVQPNDVEEAKALGATDLEIHDTVLIAALFCMYNRYVDGLRTQRPENPVFYDVLGQRITTRGYLMPENGYHALDLSST